MSNLPSLLLGQSQLRSSRLAYGCWRIAGTKDPSLVTPEKETAGRASVTAAYEAGYTLFDLADIYGGGACERIFGQVLREVSGMRDRVVVTTKCGVRLKDQPDKGAPYRYDASADHIVESCHASLKRLGIDTIDLYLVHRPDFLLRPEEVAEAFSRLKQAGQAREFGVSNFRPSQLTALQRACPMPLTVNQVELHLMHLAPFQDGTLDQCLAEKITPLAWSPLAGGRLVDANPIDLNTPDHAHRKHVREVVDRLAREYEVSRTVLALAWLLKHPSSIVPIIGSTVPERIREAATATAVDLSREAWYQLLEVSHGRRLP